jgi:hypothetical protein
MHVQLRSKAAEVRWARVSLFWKRKRRESEKRKRAVRSEEKSERRDGEDR